MARYHPDDEYIGHIYVKGMTDEEKEEAYEDAMDRMNDYDLYNEVARL